MQNPAKKQGDGRQNLAGAKHYRFEPLDRVWIGGVDYVYVRPTDGGHVLRQRESALEEAFDESEMARIVAAAGFGHDRRFYAGGNAFARERSGVARMSDIPADERPTVAWKVGYCDSFLQMEAAGDASRSDESMQAAIDTIQRSIVPVLTAFSNGSRKRRAGSTGSYRSPPCPRTLRTWITIYEKAGRTSHALRERTRRCGNRDARLEPDAYALIREAAQAYRSETRPTIQCCYDGMAVALRETNAARAGRGEKPIPMPSIKALSKAIRKIPKFELHADRKGLDSARRSFRLVKGSPDATRPGERVEMDEWSVQLHTILQRAGVWGQLTPEAKKAATGRWLVCGAIDVATRCILGMRMAPTATASLAKATLLMTVSDKTLIARAAGAVTPWDMALNPDVIATDGGSAFTSVEFVSAAADLGAAHNVCMGSMPHLRGTLERLFGTIDSGLLTYFTGRAFADSREKGDYDAEARASITKEGFATALVRYVVDAYHNRPHAGLGGETPRNAWQRLTELYGVCPPPGRDDRRAIFGLELERVVSMRGVRLLGLHYADAALGAEILQREQFLATIRVDEQDLSRVSILAADGIWRTLPCMTEGLDGVSARDWIDAWADLRRRFAAEAALTRDVVLDALAAIRQLAGRAEEAAGIHSAPLGREKLDAAERELLGGYAMPEDGAGPAEDDDADPLARTIQVGMPNADAPAKRVADGQGPNGEDGEEPPDPFTVEEE